MCHAIGSRDSFELVSPWQCCLGGASLPAPVTRRLQRRRRREDWVGLRDGLNPHDPTDGSADLDGDGLANSPSTARSRR
ncbi:MAG: hypothetical protein DIU71_05925 [Proteobacteria bacterium]|nr:MAG: hypothetical protein DIU71_05925 [Pseudomonadota bacterium]